MEESERGVRDVGRRGGGGGEGGDGEGEEGRETLALRRGLTAGGERPGREKKQVYGRKRA